MLRLIAKLICLFRCDHEWHIPVLPYVGERPLKVCGKCRRCENLRPFERLYLERKYWG